MALLKTDHAKGVKPMPIAAGSEVVAVRIAYSLAAALAAGDIVYLGDLPEDHVPVDFIADADDLDTGATPTLELQAGILNANKDDLDLPASGGASWIGNSNVAQAGGLARASDKSITRVTPSSSSRKAFGFKVATGPATGATSGVLAGTLFYRAASYGS